MLGETSTGALGAPGTDTLNTKKNKESTNKAMGKETHENSPLFFMLHMPKASIAKRPATNTIHASEKLMNNTEAKSTKATPHRTTRKSFFAELAMIKARGSKTADSIATLFVVPTVLNAWLFANAKNGSTNTPYNCKSARSEEHTSEL